MQERNAVDRMTSQDGIPLRMQWLVPVFHFPFGFHSFRYMIFISITGIAGKCTTPSFEALTSLVPKNIANVEDFLENHTKHTTKYIIDRTLRRELREMLDQMNINERMLFPGLDGTAKWIARHFYVSEENA